MKKLYLVVAVGLIDAQTGKLQAGQPATVVSNGSLSAQGKDFAFVTFLLAVFGGAGGYGVFSIQVYGTEAPAVASQVNAATDVFE